MTILVATCADCVFFRTSETSRWGSCTLNAPRVQYIPECGEWETSPDPDVEIDRPACRDFEAKVKA